MKSASQRTRAPTLRLIASQAAITQFMPLSPPKAATTPFQGAAAVVHQYW
ncbi:hypothetical protein [Fodinicurvata halophila]